MSPQSDAAVFNPTIAQENGKSRQEKPSVVMPFLTLKAISCHRVLKQNEPITLAAEANYSFFVLHALSVQL